MGEYIPLEDVLVHLRDSTEEVNGQDRFHVKLSELALNFTKQNQSKTILLVNVGWDKLTFHDLVNANPVFKITEDLPQLLLPGKSYSFTIAVDNLAAGQYSGGLYVDVGDSYGYKFIKLTASIT